MREFFERTQRKLQSDLCRIQRWELQSRPALMEQERRKRHTLRKVPLA